MLTVNQKWVPNTVFAALLFLAPLVFMGWWGDRGLPPRAFLNIAETKAVFISCYLLLGIWLAYHFFKPDMLYFILVSLGLTYTAFQFAHMNTIAGAGHDLPHHLNTIEYYTEHFSRQPLDGWRNEANQPPLYYMVAAQWQNLTQWLGFMNWRSLSYFSYLHFVVFVVCVAKLADLVVYNKILKYFAFMLFILWPVHMVHCCRVTNDIPAYTYITIFMLAWLWWLNTQHKRYFIFAIVAACIAFLTKLSAILIVVFAVVSTFFTVLGGRNFHGLMASLPRKRTLVICAIAFVFCASYNTVHMAYLKYQSPHHVSLFVGERSSDRALEMHRAPVSIDFYTSFSLDRFLHTQGRMIRDNFFNAQLSQFIFGELNGFKKSAYAYFINLTFLLMVGLCIIELIGLMVFRTFQVWCSSLIWLSFYIGSVCLIMVIQIMDPHYGWSDVRLIYPAIAAVILFFISVMDAVSDKKILFIINYLLVVIFISCMLRFNVEQFYLI